MHNLLSEGFYRLFRKKAFRWVMALTVIHQMIAIWQTWSSHRKLLDQNVPSVAPFDELMLQYGFYAVFAAAVLIPFFIGGDFTDGTLRNRLMTGYSRTSVYLANWLVSSAGVLLCAAANIAVCCTVGRVLLSDGYSSVGRILFLLTLSLLSVLACCAVFTWISMLLAQKAFALAGCVLLVAMMVFVGGQLIDALNQEAFWQDYIVSTSDGYVMCDAYPNPLYVSGFRRQVYLFLYDLTPFTQIFEASTSYEPDMAMTGDPVRMALCSLGLIISACAGGALAFNRKEIR